MIEAVDPGDVEDLEVTVTAAGDLEEDGAGRKREALEGIRVATGGEAIGAAAIGATLALLAEEMIGEMEAARLGLAAAAAEAAAAAAAIGGVDRTEVAVVTDGVEATLVVAGA